MPQGLVVHAALGENKQTQVLTRERVRIGSRDDCDLRLRPPFVLAPNNLLLELARANGHYRVSEFNRHLRITHNGQPLTQGAAIEDGDEVRVEALRLVVPWLRDEVEMMTVTASIPADELALIAAAEAMGMVRQARLREHVVRPGGRVDLVLYQALNPRREVPRA